MKALNLIVCILVIVGAINWGLVGAFNFNLVEMLFSKVPYLVNTVYILVGLSGLYQIFLSKKCCS